MFNNVQLYMYMYMENYMHSTLVINRHNKESRHGEQTLTYTTHYGKYVYTYSVHTRTCMHGTNKYGFSLQYLYVC